MSPKKLLRQPLNGPTPCTSITPLLVPVGLITLLFFLYFTASCSESPDNQKPPSLRIGWIGPLSGQVSLLGVDNLNAVKMAIDDFKNSSSSHQLLPDISLVSRDDQYNAQHSLEAYRELVRVNKPHAIFVNTYTALFLLADQALRDGILLINSIDNDANLARLNKNTFLIAKQTESLAKVITSSILVSTPKPQVSILHFNGDDFMPQVADLVAEQIKKAGGRIIMQDYPPDTRDFTHHFNSSSPNTDAYVLLGYSELGSALSLIRQRGIDSPIYTANTMMQQEAGEAMEGVRFFDFTHLDGNSDMASSFLQRYQQRFGHIPTLQWTAFQAYDATNIVLQAATRREHSVEPSPTQEYKHSQKKDDLFIEQIRENLFNTKNYPGLGGQITLHLDGSSRGIQPGLYRWSSGKVVREPLQ